MKKKTDNIFDGKVVLSVNWNNRCHLLFAYFFSHVLLAYEITFRNEENKLI